MKNPASITGVFLAEEREKHRRFLDELLKEDKA